MKTIKLGKFSDEGRLHNVEDAAFLRARQIGAADVIDFTGIEEVSAPYLDALLRGFARAELRARLSGLSGAAADVVARWLAADGAQGAQRATPATPAQEATPQAAHPLGADLRGGLQSQDGRFTPTRLAARLRTQLTKYIEGAYPLSDEILIKARRRLLHEADGGHLLAQDPFVETTPRYRPAGQSYGELGLPGGVSRLFEELSQTPMEHDPQRTLLYPGMYLHQARAYQTYLRDGKDLVVATGTGSGKTECFLLPLLGQLYREAAERPQAWARRGVRCLILYPMNALVNDQLARLRLLFGSEALTSRFRHHGGRHPLFGMYTGRTPYAGPRDTHKDGERVAPLLEYYLKDLDAGTLAHLRRMGRYPAKDLRAFFAAQLEAQAVYGSGKKKGQRYTRHNWEDRLKTGAGDRELLTRHEMVYDPERGEGAAPDVLVTNYSMLEYMLMRPFERPLFEQTREWLQEPGSRFLLVLDEAHMYRGAKGAEVACLVRRLLSRLGIIDQPEKLGFIATSASLGQASKAGDAAHEQLLWRARSFAADLCGKPPTDIALITGEREVPEPAEPGSEALAVVLAAVDLDALHAGAGPLVLRAALAPVLEALGRPLAPEVVEEDDLLRALHAALQGRPLLHQVLKVTSGHAVALGALARGLFPGMEDSARARRATEVLLTLATLARRTREEPGLLPTRVHMMFRGLSGLYACINPRCHGRQEAPGVEAPLGKLFTAPRLSCDACNARVFEVASCRDCGAVYALGYAPEGDLDRLEFLWGETEGVMTKVQLLAQPPNRQDGLEEVRVQLSSGLLPTQGSAAPGAGEGRSLWFSLDRETGRRSAEFKQCPICQVQTRRQSRISSFATRGEQPFTVLVETQFAEQPPQNLQEGLLNQGRKVLVFSDGRQKAARLAPALETSHSRDSFRQVLALAVHDLSALDPQGLARLSHLYPAVVHVCLARGVDLVPEEDENSNAELETGRQIFAQHLNMARKGMKLATMMKMVDQGQLPVPLFFARKMFNELTDRFFSLPAIGMGMVVIDPAMEEFLLQGFPAVGLSGEEARRLLQAWVRVQLERRCFLHPGASLGKLGEGQFDRPEGIVRGRLGDLLPGRFRDFVLSLVGDEGKLAEVAAWFDGLLGSGLLMLVNDQSFLQPVGLALRLGLSVPWLRCQTCNRLHPEGIRDRCYECLGTLRDASADPVYLDARSGYYRDQILRVLSGTSVEPFGLATAEHSAQLSGMEEDEAFTKTERYELRFQDLRIKGLPPIDVLSCTTTMEVGIDIGTLSGVSLRNVPPHVANYQQRAGRAGRRGRSIASVVTFAEGGSHDAYYYQNPDLIVSGAVRPPVVYVDNQKVLERHINAFLVQSFFHEAVASDPGLYRLFESLGTVEQFLSEQAACSLPRLSAWLRGNEERLRGLLRAWVPAYSHGLGKETPAAAMIVGAVERLLEALGRHLPVAAFQRRESLGQVEREALERVLGENLLQVLINRAILPRYAFPTDTVSFWVPRHKRTGDPKYRRVFDYQPQRDLQIALSEYAPGRTLTIDKYRFTAAALYSPYQPEVGKTLARACSYTACRACGYVSLRETDAALERCPVCAGERLFKHRFVTPEGFAPDVNQAREYDRGGSVSYAGSSTPAKLEVQTPEAWDAELYSGRLRYLESQRNLVVVNKGVGDRGFKICAECGLAEPEFGPKHVKSKLGPVGTARSHQSPVEEGKLCSGSTRGPYFLGHQFPTDVLLLRLRLEAPLRCRLGEGQGRAGRMALTSLVEALCLAATRTLQTDEGELGGNWNPVLGAEDTEVDLYLYDLLPGGAGYTRQVKENLDAVLQAAAVLLAGCDCETSCYRCLRHYENRIRHGSLDRHLALALLRYLLVGEVPQLTAAEQTRALEPLLDVLRLRGRAHAPRTLVDQTVVPLVVRSPQGEESWVDVHHPLVDPELAPSAVMEAAEARLLRVVPVSSHLLRFELADAVTKVLQEAAA